VAISDPLGITAQPLDTLARRGDKHICRELAALVEARDVSEVVVGLPLELSGAEGSAAQKVHAFVDRLSRYISVPITLWDERMTSLQAERDMREVGKLKWRKRRGKIDQVAAQLILQAVLDQRNTDY
jgi:putative Holliday junction resolvase